MKKLLAILCAVAMIICSLFTGVVVAAEDQALTIYKPSQLLMGAGPGLRTGVVQGNQFNVNESSAPLVSGLLNVEFSAKVFVGNLPTKLIKFYSFQHGYLTGLDIVFADTGIELANEWGYDTTPLNFPGFTESNFDLTFTSVAVDNEGDGNVNDMKLTLKINDTVKETVINNSIEVFEKVNALGLNNVVLWDTDYVFSPDYNAATNLPVITFEDFHGFVPGAHYIKAVAENDSADWRAPKQAMANTVFEAEVMLDKNGYIKYPLNEVTWGSFTLRLDNTNGKNLLLKDEIGIYTGAVHTMATITPEQFGWEEFMGKKFNYKVAVEVVNHDDESLEDADGNVLIDDFKNDLKITYFINDVKVYSDFFDCEDDDGEGTAVTDEHGNLLGYDYQLTGPGTRFGSGQICANNGIFDLPGSKLPVLNEIVPSDTSVPYYTEDDGDTYYHVLRDNTTFNTDVHFPIADGPVIELQFATLSLESGRVVLNHKDGRKIYITPDGENFADKKFNLKLSAQQMDLDLDGYPDDIKFGIFVNNQGKFITMLNSYASIEEVTFGVYGGTTISEPDRTPEYLQHVTFEDSLPDNPDNTPALPVDVSMRGNLQSVNWLGRTNTYKVMGTRLEVNFKVNETNAINVFATHGVFYEGDPTVDKQKQGVTLHFAPGYFYPMFGVDQIGAGLIYEPIPADLYANNIKLEITVEEADCDLNGDGIFNDIRIGYFINDKILFGRFLSPESTIDDYAAKIASLKEYNSNFRCLANDYSGYFTMLPNTSKAAEYGLEDFEEITLADFGIASGEYTPKNENHSFFHAPINLSKGDTLSGKVLKTTLTLPISDQYSIFNIAGWSNWLGARITTHGGLVISYATEDANVSKYNNTVSLPDFKVGEANNIAVSYKYEYDCLYIGIWIDGKLQNNQFYPLRGWGKSSVNQHDYSSYVGLYGNAAAGMAGTFVVDNGTDSVVNNEVTSENNFVTLTPVDGKTVTVNNGAPLTEETTYTAIDEYVVKTVDTTNGAFDFTGTKTYVIYKDKDLNGDNTVDILDFIIAKKNAGGARPLTSKVALAAAGKADAADLITPAELIAIKRAVLFG